MNDDEDAHAYRMGWSHGLSFLQRRVRYRLYRSYSDKKVLETLRMIDELIDDSREEIYRYKRK